MDINTFIEQISLDLGIKKSNLESELDFKGRIIFSASSAWFLTMLRNSSNANLSISYIKNKLLEKIQAYYEIFQFTNTQSKESIKQIVDYIFKVHQKMGSFYHTPYYICPALEKGFIFNNTYFCRTPTNPLEYHFSGLGVYRKMNMNDNEKAIKEDYFEIFGLPKEPPSKILYTLLNERKWTINVIEPYIEYLNIFRTKNESYYAQKALFENYISLGRVKTEYDYYYKLCYKGNQYIFQEWEHQENFPNYTALALLEKYDNLHVVVYINKKSFVRLKLSFTLPYQEEQFIRLFCWPTYFLNLKNRWEFVVDWNVYPIIKHRLCYLGFKIKEENL